MKLQNSYFLLRHGATIYQTNLKNYTYPWPEISPVRITKTAEKKILQVSKRLKGERIEKIYSSDIFRAKQTAGIVSRIIGVPVKTDKRLRDYNMGIFQGGKKAEFYKYFSDPNKRFSKRPEGGESWNDLRKRVKNFIKFLEKEYKDKKFLVVSHGDALWMFEGVIKNMTNQQLLDEIMVKYNNIKPGELREFN